MVKVNAAKEKARGLSRLFRSEEERRSAQRSWEDARFTKSWGGFGADPDCCLVDEASPSINIKEKG